MIFQHMEEQNGWMVLRYSTTWHYGYDFMLDAAQAIIDTDFQDKLQRVAAAEVMGGPDTELLQQVNDFGNILRDCPATVKECGVLTVSGISRLMECPVQFSFFNQTNLVSLVSPLRQYFQEHGAHVFDNYMNSIEIKAYCKDTERRTLQKMGQ